MSAKLPGSPVKSFGLPVGNGMIPPMGEQPTNASDLLRSLLEAGPAVEIGDVDPTAARRGLESLSLSGESLLGAVVSDTGGLVVDAGWIRILGSGSGLLPRALDSWNQLSDRRRDPFGLLVGEDAVGGFFALSDLDGPVHYLAPDSLDYEDLQVGYGDWLAWCLGAGPSQFYEEERWDGWREDVAALGADEVFAFEPPLVAEGPPIGKRKRTPTAVAAVHQQLHGLRAKLSGLAEGDQFTLEPGP